MLHSILYGIKPMPLFIEDVFPSGFDFREIDYQEVLIEDSKKI